MSATRTDCPTRTAIGRARGSGRCPWAMRRLTNWCLVDLPAAPMRPPEFRWVVASTDGIDLFPDYAAHIANVHWLFWREINALRPGLLRILFSITLRRLVSGWPSQFVFWFGHTDTPSESVSVFRCVAETPGFSRSRQMNVLLIYGHGLTALTRLRKQCLH